MENGGSRQAKTQPPEHQPTDSMSTIQQRKVKTLSDQAEMRSAQWVDQASLLQIGHPEKHLDHADIDSANGASRHAAAGASSTGAYLFDDLQTAENGTGRKTSASKTKRRNGMSSESAMRDRVSAGQQAQQSRRKGRKASRSSRKATKTNVMTAELPFATLANKDDAALRKQRRQPNASPFGDTQGSRRSSLPTFQPHPIQNSPRALQQELQPSEQPRTLSAPEWKDAWAASMERALTADVHPGGPHSPESPFQRLSQLLAKPEVGGYLVMGALIACTFLI